MPIQSHTCPKFIAPESVKKIFKLIKFEYKYRN